MSDLRKPEHLPEQVQRDINSFMHTTDKDPALVPISFGYEVVKTAFGSLAKNIPQLSSGDEGEILMIARQQGVLSACQEYVRRVLLTGGE